MSAKTHSTVEPAWYFLDEIKTKEGMPVLVVRINWDKEQMEVQEPELHMEWKYNSQVIEHIPTLTLAESDVRSYIETHEVKLLAEALNEWNAQEVIDADITEVREQTLVPDYEEKIFNEKDVYGATITEIDVTKEDKRYIKAKLLNRNVTKWCYASGSVLRDYQESKIGIGDKVVVLYDPDNQYPIVIDRVVL